MNSNSKTIENWMLSNVETKGYERYDDLHVDQIDSAWRSRDSWIDAGFAAFQTAIDIRDCNGLNLVVVLAYSLISSEKPLGIDFETRKELQARLDQSPPSLYLFPRGREPRTQTGILGGENIATNVVVKDVNPHVLGASTKIKRCYYMEFKQAGFEEYSRTLFVEG